MSREAPANWYRDPSGRHELRYWDGSCWTEHVASGGKQGADPLASETVVRAVGQASRRVQRQVRAAGIPADAEPGGGSLLSERVLVVNQRAKIIEVNAEYAVYDQRGRQIGAVREVGQSLIRNALTSRNRAKGTKRLQILDQDGRVLLLLTRPSTIVRSTVTVHYGDGTNVGKIVQKNFGVVGKVRFALECHGKRVGSINADGWDTWDFNIQDASDNEIARISKSGTGTLRKSSTKRDKYVV